ncbi:hypothetical protein c7_R1106 [Megavirus courdo7]|uniref:Uncharacterized protein n=1 Tax=Megavirus courdo7 TaxID=1128135 RepID=H2EC30_9VIRU|nr:hypothetical protein c7_R1106 [Megavirus courdo7]
MDLNHLIDKFLSEIRDIDIKINQLK